MGYRAILAMAFLLVFTVFVLQNTEIVDITFLFWRFSVSRVLLLVGAVAVGCLVGIFIGWETFGKRRGPRP